MKSWLMQAQLYGLAKVRADGDKYVKVRVIDRNNLKSVVQD